MLNAPPEVLAASFAMVVAFGLVIFAAFGERRPSFSRSGRGNTVGAPTTMRDIRLQSKATDRLLAPLAGKIGTRMRRFTPLGSIEAMEHRIAVAGMTSKWTVERLLLTKLGFAGGGALIAGYFLSASVTPRNLVMGLVIIAGGYVLPSMSLDRRAKDRTSTIERQLPDLLDQMTISVEAGLGFDAALGRVAMENEGPLAEEFGRMMQDRQLGMSREEAFDKLLGRTDSGDLRHFVLGLSQATKHGMPLAGVLRVQAEEMRQKRRVRAEEKALSLPVKLIMPLVLCILPALFTVILGPAVFRFRQNDF
jgi:tight adherence protein C